MAIFSKNGTSGPQTHVTYSHRSAPVTSALFSPTRSNDNNEDDETKGGQAFGRISQRNMKAPKPLQKLRAPVTPFVEPEEDDIAEAISRSQRDLVGYSSTPQTEESHNSDVVEVEPTAINSQLSKSKGKTRSYTSLGSNSASAAAPPHEVLHDVLDDMDVAARTLHKFARGGVKPSAQKLVRNMRTWQGTINKVIYASEVAEHERCKDMQAQLDFDRDIEQAHRDEINKLNQTWMEKMHKKEQEWQQRIDELQKGAKAQQQSDEPQPCATDPPCSRFQDKVSCLIEVNALNSSHAAAATQSEPVPAGKASSLQNEERLTDITTQPLHSKYDETNQQEIAVAPIESIHGPMYMSGGHTTRPEPSNPTLENKAVINREQRNEHPGSAAYTENNVSLGKHKLDEEGAASSSSKDANSSPKKLKTGLTN
jgi:hypothetical protein